MKRLIAVTALSAITFTSCVSKKKYLALQEDYQQTHAEKEELASRLGAIEERVSGYNAKISSLTNENDSLNYHKLSLTDLTAMSEANKDAMRKTLENVDDSLLVGATTLKDSINLAVAHNLEQQINNSGENRHVQVSVDGTVVMVNLSDELLFRSGSARVNREAYPVLEKLAAVINTEPAMEVLVEGHTDSRTVVKESYLIDNWDLSLRRSASVVRLLQNRFEVNPEKLIAAGRSSYDPATQGNSAEAMAKNRRTTIAIIPNLDKFLALLDSENKIEVSSDVDLQENQGQEMDALKASSNNSIELEPEENSID